MQKVKYYKCPHCGVKYQSLQTWGNHVSIKHPDLIPEGWSYGRYFYYIQTGKKAGSCIICKNPTEWHESTLKYERFCTNPKCKEQYRESFKNRMMDKYGKVHLLDDPEQQRKMLANKHISGQYTFLDGGKVTYTGTYELDFLKFMDKFLHFKSSDIMIPSPHTYYYDYKNPNDTEHEGRHFYIPDAFIPSLSLEIEIKQNTNMHPKLLAIDKVKEVQKDEMMKSQPGINYFKIVEKNYAGFLDYLGEKTQEIPDMESYEETEKELTSAMESISFQFTEAFSKYDFRAEEKALEAAGYSKENKCPVFIVLTKGNSLLAKIIMGTTGDEFSHACIAFNPELTPIYSFGTKKIGPKVPEMGFVKTTPYSNVWFTNKSKVPYSIFITYVSSYNLEKMNRRLEYFTNNANDLKFSIMGLIRVFLHIKSPKRQHWFCSMFVAEILSAGKTLDKDSSLYRPETLKDISDVEFLYSGDNITDYDSTPVKKAMKKLERESIATEGRNTYSDTYVPDKDKKEKLSSFTTKDITPALVKEYIKAYKPFENVELSTDSYGELFLDSFKVVGHYNTIKQDGTVWLQDINVATKYRKRGLASQILNKAIRKAKVTNVAIDPENKIMLHVLLKAGFVDYGKEGKKLLFCKQ